MDSIKQQEEKIERLRRDYSACTSKAYRAFIASVGKLEKEKLLRMRAKLEKNGRERLL